MIKQNKKLLLLTSVITLLPVFIGLFLWNQLPDSVATHFGLNNQPDGYSSKAFAVFGLPLILLAVHLVCVVATNIDPKSKDINKINKKTYTRRKRNEYIFYLRAKIGEYHLHFFTKSKSS